MQMSDREMVFHQSEKSGRWWLEIQNENYLIDFENQLTSTWNKAVVNQHPNFSVDHSGKIMPKPGTFANLKKG